MSTDSFKDSAMSPKTFSANVHLAIFVAMEILIYFDRGVLSILLPFIKKEFGNLSGFESGLLGGIFMLGYMIASPVFARLGQRSPTWTLRSIGIGLCIWLASGIITFFVKSFWFLAFVRMLTGVGEASFCSVAPSIIDDSSPAYKKSFYLGLFFMNLYVGQAIGYMVGTFFDSWSSGKILFLVQGLLMIPFAALLFLKPSKFCVPEAQDKVETNIFKQMWILLKNPVFTWMVLGYGAFMFSVGGYAFWGPTFLNDEWEMSAFARGTGFGALTACTGIFGTAFGGRALDWWFKRQDDQESDTRSWISCKLSCIFIILAFGFCVIVPWVPSGIIFFSFFGPAEFFLFASTAPTNISIMTSVSDALRSQALALTVGISHALGDFPSPILIGLIRDAVNNRVAMCVTACWLTLSIICWGVAAWVAGKKRESRRQFSCTATKSNH